MQNAPSKTRKFEWANVLFLTITPLIALIAEPLYAYAYGIPWQVWCVFAFYMAATGLSITAGYHRLFSHRTYQAHTGVKLFFLLFGAAAFENSALKWSADHRRHHAFTDTDKDPYNIREGFFYAHMAWVCYQNPYDENFDNVRDLQKDPWVRWQHRYYVPLGIGLGMALPLLLGYTLGDAIGCFLLAGIVRIVLVHHSTFLVNSLAHWSGAQPYSLRDTAKDNFLVSLLTYGEGYHNFHHRFPYDYRNGIRWYQWDPSKWLIRGLARLGWVERLRTASPERIFRARMQVQRELVHETLILHPFDIRKKMEEKLHAAYEAMMKARVRWEELKAEYRALKDPQYRKIASALEKDLQIAREHFQAAHHAWRALVQNCLQAAPVPA